MKVLIVGAGVAGLALAATLVRDGHQLRVVEARPEHNERYGAGLLLTPNAVRALDAVLSDSHWQGALRRVNQITYADASDNPLFEIRCESGWPAPFATLRHHRLRTLLLARVRSCVQHETSVSAIRSDNGQVTFTNGESDRFDLIIGADGVHSRTRALLFGETGAASAAPFRGFRCITRNVAAIAEPRQLIGNGATLLLYPLPDGELYIGAGPVAGALMANDADPAVSIRASFRGYGPSAVAALAELPDAQAFIPTKYWTVRQQPWLRGRCGLIGDAAHASPPTLSQGAAMALEDAVVLAESLRSHTDISEALQVYERRRRPRVERVQSESVQRLAANLPITPHAARVRDQIARRIGCESLESTWKWLAHELP
jgi:2-polyprenyl-6-methoxyphenol hydroxylase-like FAD-dependent oxidoreductase